MPEISRSQWQKALKKDEADLASVREAIKTLRGGGEVQNLTLTNALEVERALEQVIANKQRMIKKLAAANTAAKAFRSLVAMEHPSEEARRNYLKEHPGADPSNHTVSKGDDNSIEAKMLRRTRKELARAEQRLRAWREDGEGDLSDQEEDTLEREISRHKAEIQNLTKQASNAAQAYKTALMAERVSTVFPTEKARRDYLKEHPKADPANHSVKDESRSKSKQEAPSSTVSDEVSKLLDEVGSNSQSLSIETAVNLKKLRSLAKDKKEVPPDLLNKVIKDLRYEGRRSDADKKDAARFKRTVTQLLKLRPGKKTADYKRDLDLARAEAAAESFKQAVAVEEVASRFAMEFDSPEALKKYLKEHPGADKSKHTVKKKDESKDSDSGDDDDYEKYIDSEKHQSSDAYSSGRAKGYYPQKMPKGMKLPEVPEKFTDAMKSMPDEDLDTEDAYEHRAVKKLTKQVLTKLKKGELSVDDAVKDGEEAHKLGMRFMSDQVEAKTDKEADPPRFAGRKMTNVWRAYKEALGEYRSSKK